MVQVLGLEPRLNGSEPPVLPIRRLLIMAPSVGIEPTTVALTARCSTDELRWNMAMMTGAAPASLSLTRRHSAVELHHHLG